MPGRCLSASIRTRKARLYLMAALAAHSENVGSRTEVVRCRYQFVAVRVVEHHVLDSLGEQNRSPAPPSIRTGGISVALGGRVNRRLQRAREPLVQDGGCAVGGRLQQVEHHRAAAARG